MVTTRRLFGLADYLALSVILCEVLAFAVLDPEIAAPVTAGAVAPILCFCYGAITKKTVRSIAVAVPASLTPYLTYFIVTRPKWSSHNTVDMIGYVIVLCCIGGAPALARAHIIPYFGTRVLPLIRSKRASTHYRVARRASQILLTTLLGANALFFLVSASSQTHKSNSYQQGFGTQRLISTYSETDFWVSSINNWFDLYASPVGWYVVVVEGKRVDTLYQFKRDSGDAGNTALGIGRLIGFVIVAFTLWLINPPPKKRQARPVSFGPSWH